MLSLIVPVRDWPAERIDACVSSFRRLKSKALDEIIVVDFGSKTPPSLSRARNLRVISVKAKRWSLAEAINVGVMASRNPIVAKVDADIVIAPESAAGFDAAAEACRQAGGMVIVQAVDLPEGIAAGAALAASTGELQRMGRLRPRWGQGGLCLFSVEDWNAIGGFDARYHGWGNEDNDYANRLRRSGRPVRWAPAGGIRIFHVWHPPSHAAKDIVKARSENRQIFAEDHSNLRPMRFLASRADRIASPNIASRPRPLVTVAIASMERKNRLRMLGEAVRGFIGQIDNDFEILIADNGSADEDRAALQTAMARLRRNANIRVVHLDRASIPGARNIITDEARGRYICVADDDDIPLPNRLRDHLACFERDGTIHGSHGGWIDFDELTGIVESNTGGDRVLATLLFGRGKVTAHPASFYRRDVLQAVRYDESIRSGSDLDLAVRLANLGLRIAHTGTYLTLRRFHSANVTLTDLAGQIAIGVEGRQRVRGTLGNAFELYLRDIAKKAQAQIPCGSFDLDQVIPLIPRYAGRWRLLVPLAGIGQTDGEARLPPPAENLPDGLGATERPGVNAVEDAFRLAECPGDALDDFLQPAAQAPSSRPDLAEFAEGIARLVKGDVGVVDCGINPALYVVSDPVQGVGRALKLRREISRHLNVTAELMTDVEYQRRRSQRLDWANVLGTTAGVRLGSAATKDVGEVLTAINRIPQGTMLRAMTAIAADFNCEDNLFRMVTAPIPAGQDVANIQRFLEMHTQRPFEILGEGAIRMKLGVRHDRAKSLVTVESAETCDTDSWPLVADIQFRRYQSEPDLQIGVIGAAILFARHCGSVVEFPGVRISLDVARAIRTILPGVQELHPIDGARRDIGHGTTTLVVGEVRRIVGNGIGAPVARSARIITWNGDFIAPGERSSLGSLTGDLFTNARLVAGEAATSIAVALLWGAKDLRDILVPAPTAEEEDVFNRIADGLEYVGIKLRALGDVASASDSASARGVLRSTSAQLSAAT